MNNKVAKIILEQLGGNKFVVMTGSKCLVGSLNGLTMKLAGNKSGANYLRVELTERDDYKLIFWKITELKLKIENGKIVDFKSERITEIKVVDGVYCDQLQEIFTSVTGLITHL